MEIYFFFFFFFFFSLRELDKLPLLFGIISVFSELDTVRPTLRKCLLLSILL